MFDFIESMGETGAVLIVIAFFVVIFLLSVIF